MTFDAPDGVPTPPDPTDCAVEPMSGVDDLAYCRASKGHLCPHVLPFGDEHFCRHPGRAGFVVRLKALR